MSVILTDLRHRQTPNTSEYRRNKIPHLIICRDTAGLYRNIQNRMSISCLQSLCLKFGDFRSGLRKKCFLTSDYFSCRTSKYSNFFGQLILFKGFCSFKNKKNNLLYFYGFQIYCFLSNPPNTRGYTFCPSAPKTNSPWRDSLPYFCNLCG